MSPFHKHGTKDKSRKRNAICACNHGSSLTRNQQGRQYLAVCVDQRSEKVDGNLRVHRDYDMGESVHGGEMGMQLFDAVDVRK